MEKILPTLLRIFGVCLISVGLVAAYYGPLEIYVLYFFAEGGRFHYAGFGMGSIWFAALVVQNIGYYVIAALLLPIGVGHLKLRRWALTFTQLYLWFWLGAGLLILGNALMLIPAVLKLELEPGVLQERLAITGVVGLVLLVALPILALGFYRSATVRAVFTRHDANRYWTERYPLPLLAVLLLFVILIVVMHIAIFLQVLFPFFGQILSGRQAMYLVALCIVVAGILIYGLVQLKPWAWWGSLVYISLLTVSTVWSFFGYSVHDLILMMKLPDYEIEFLGNLTILQDFYPVGMLALPLLTTLALIVYARRYFGHGGHHSSLATS